MGRKQYSAQTVFYGHGIAEPATMPAVGAERMTAVAARDLDDLLSNLSGGVITFDDGYANNLTTALPILEKHNRPATIFVTTGFVARTHPPMERVVACAAIAGAAGEDILASLVGIRHQEPAVRFSVAQRALTQMTAARRDQWLARLMDACGLNTAELTHDYLSFEQLKELAASPLITIGAHTISHPDLRHADDAELARELVGARAQLESWLDEPITSLAYPYGATDTRVRRATAAAGYRRAYSTVQPRWRRALPFYHRFNLPRTDLSLATRGILRRADKNAAKH